MIFEDCLTNFILNIPVIDIVFLRGRAPGTILLCFEEACIVDNALSMVPAHFRCVRGLTNE
jgi:hypothetical protein